MLCKAESFRAASDSLNFRENVTLSHHLNDFTRGQQHFAPYTILSLDTLTICTASLSAYSKTISKNTKNTKKKVLVSEEKRDILEHPDEFPEFNKEHTALKNRETAVRNPSAHTNVTTLPSH